MTQRFDPYDRRGYSTLDVAEGYAVWAPCYDETADNRLDIALLSVLTSVDLAVWTAPRTLPAEPGGSAVGYELGAQSGWTASTCLPGCSNAPH